MLRVLFLAFVLCGTSAIGAANPPDVPADDAVDSRIAALISECAALSLPARVERAFVLTLHASADALRHGELSNAATLLRTFAHEVRGVKHARRIPASVADPLIQKAESLIATMTARTPSLRNRAKFAYPTQARY